MKLIDGKKTLSIVTLFVFCFTNSSCKKVAKKDTDYCGHWVTSDYGSCAYSLEISQNSNGNFLGTGQNDCMKISSGGKVKIFKDLLFVGNWKFKILDKPIVASPGDSIYYEAKQNKIFMKMTLRSSNFHNGQYYEFFKIQE